jgi:pyrimidine-nucleoside phosphorylase
MRAVDILRKKRDGLPLTPTEIDAFIEAATHGRWPPYQLSALLMAIFLRGMTPEETAHLTAAMARSGVRLDLADLPGVKVDKHSTGGVGDKTSLILAPLATACGVIVPMMSGRGLGHTGGTLDKLESIPGFRVGLGLDEFRSALREVGCALIGQTVEVAPADKVLYALRDATATVESLPLICASILSKKLAEGIDALVLDVKCGHGAFMKTLPEARRLAEALVAIGRANGLAVQALITSMDAPLGHAIGNALEVVEAVETLKGRGPVELERLSVELAARMVLMAGRAADLLDATAQVREALASGRGVEVFRRIVQRQGGDPRVVDDYSLLPTAPTRTSVTAARAGYIAEIDAMAVAQATVLVGAGRDKAEDPIDPAVGALIRVQLGELVQAGDVLAQLHHRDSPRTETALRLLRHAFVISDASPEPRPLILETMG